jgi:hypothetical protein
MEIRTTMKNIMWAFFIPSLLYGAASKPPCPSLRPQQRDLLILPDTASEESIAAFGYALINRSQINKVYDALGSQVIPVLMELSIWKRFVKDVAQRIAQKKLKVSLDYFTTHFDYYTSSNFLLCIPKKTTDHGFNLSTWKRIENSLLLKPSFLDPITSFFKPTLAAAQVYYSLVKALRTLLITPHASYAWNIILLGHGGYFGGAYLARVAGITFQEFKKLLQFLNQEITTNILLYSTCFGAGATLLQAYTTNSNPDTYNFPIILAGVADAPTYSGGRHVTPTAYNTFVQKIRTTPLCTEYQPTIGLIAGGVLQAIVYQNNKLTLSSINNALQIRWPNSTHFQILELDNVITAAQSVKQTSKKTDTVTVNSPAFVFNTPYLNRTLVLTRNDHTIASAMHTKWHYLHSLVLPFAFSAQEGMNQLLSMFSAIQLLKSSHVFLIETVTSLPPAYRADQVMAFIQSTTPATLPLKKSTEIFYRIGNQGYRWVKGMAAPQLLSPALTNKYLTLFALEKDRLKTTITTTVHP